MIDKKTKIVATISDRKCDVKFLKQLYESGMDVVRLNTAHQEHGDALKVLKNVRKVSSRIGVLLDTKGPEMRITSMEKPIEVKKGDLIKFKGTSKNESSSDSCLYVNYKDFVKDVPLGANILIDDGDIELKVKQKKGGYLYCETYDSGIIKSKKSINVPNAKINLPALTKKDKDFIKFSIDNDIDFIAHSFVRSKEDVLAVQKILDRHKSSIKIIAKIENKEGVDNIDEILDNVYGIMVARGDLAVEIPAEQVPLVQKNLIKKCIAKQKPIITATQMLHSMIKNSRPTRAEVSDVANAILDGTDAIMLSGETAFGDYPLASVNTMSKIAIETEKGVKLPDLIPLYQGDKTITSYLCQSAVRIAQDLDVKEIIVSSDIAFSAELIASYRGSVPVSVKCFNERRVRELSLTYGVSAHYIKKMSKTSLLKQTLKILIDIKKIKKNDLILYLFNNLDNRSTANSIEIFKVSKYLN
ncbi:pyruvate kinase [Patescibacteria group bacterium]|nr:pyruvate kinase [Patescibacteria group bacterium]